MAEELEGWKYKVSWGLGPFEQFAEGMKITVGADHVQELLNTLDAAFGEGSGTRILARLTEATFAKAAPETAPQQQPTPSPSSSDGETCPKCGTGQIVAKHRKGTGEFLGEGCNNFPQCDYIKYWAKK